MGFGGVGSSEVLVIVMTSVNELKLWVAGSNLNEHFTIFVITNLTKIFKRNQFQKTLPNFTNNRFDNYL